MPGQEIVGCGRRAAIGQMREGDAGGLREQDCREMRGCAAAGIGDGEPARARARLLDEFLERARLQRGMHDQHQHVGGELGDRREVLDGVVGEVVHQARVDDMVRGVEQQRVAVRRRARHDGRADVAAGPAAVLDHHGLAPALRELLAEDAAEGIGRSAGRERHHQLDRLVGIGLGKRGPQRCDRQDGGQHGRHELSECALLHCFLPRLRHAGL